MIGEQYEVSFGTITYKGQLGTSTARIRVDGKEPYNWIDLDTGVQLDPELSKYAVQAFRAI
jgi:hypothetical protein